MTREEAIDMCMEVRHYLTSGNPIWDKDKVGEALDMAIEALQTPPISQRSMYQAGYRQGREEALKQVTSKLNNPDDSLLTADPEACKEQKSKLDLISRAEAIDALVKETEAEGAYGYTDITSVVHVISNLPSADRPRGYWKDGKWCSVCGMPIATDVWGTSVDESEVHYCIECGAEMRGESEE